MPPRPRLRWSGSTDPWESLRLMGNFGPEPAPSRYEAAGQLRASLLGTQPTYSRLFGTGHAGSRRLAEAISGTTDHSDAAYRAARESIRRYRASERTPSARMQGRIRDAGARAYMSEPLSNAERRRLRAMQRQPQRIPRARGASEGQGLPGQVPALGSWSGSPPSPARDWAFARDDPPGGRAH